MGSKIEETSPTKEAIKEPLRYVLLSVVSFLLTEGVLNGFLTWLIGTKLDLATVLLITGLLTAILRGVDKFLHETEKLEPTKTQNEGYLGIKGLTGF
jgi:hypothetical protein